MSDSITIKEGGASRAFGPVSRLRVAKQGTGTEDFVPESATSETTKSITENGTYFAAQDNAYGYSQVSVNCNQEADSLTGKKQDGKTYVVSKDEDGNVVEDSVPAEIRVTRPPLTIVYGNGAYISFTGMVLTLYDSDGTVWTSNEYPDGIVPINDQRLLFPVTIAEYDPDASVNETEHTYDGFGVGPWPMPVKSTGGMVSTNTGGIHKVMFEYSNIAVLTDSNGYRHDTLFCSTTPGTARLGTYGYQVDHGIPIEVWEDISVTATYTFAGKTAYYNGTGYGGYTMPNVPARNNSVAGHNLDSGKAAWVILYGNYVSSEGGVQIPVQFARPGDNEILEASFGINVLPPMQDDGGT